MQFGWIPITATMNKQNNYEQHKSNQPDRSCALAIMTQLNVLRSAK